MKPIVFNLLLLILLAGRSTGTPDQVLDVDGFPLITESAYFISPASGDVEEGLSLFPPNYTFSCPLYVVQAMGKIGPSLPVGFRPVNDKDKPLVKLLTDMNVEFHAASPCNESTIWQMGPTTDDLQRWRFVTGGGALGNPGNKTVTNWFKIDKYGHNYKLVYCPSVCSQCKVECGVLSVFKDNHGNRLLGLPPPHLKFKPLIVKFESFG